MPSRCNHTEIIVRVCYDPGSALWSVEEHCSAGGITDIYEAERLSIMRLLSVEPATDDNPSPIYHGQGLVRPDAILDAPPAGTFLVFSHEPIPAGCGVYLDAGDGVTTEPRVLFWATTAAAALTTAPVFAALVASETPARNGQSGKQVRSEIPCLPQPIPVTKERHQTPH